MLKLEEFVRLADSNTSITGYGEIEDNLKTQWLKAGRKILKDIAKALALPKGSYDIRINKGGPAVSGEITLHGEWLYVQLSQTSHGVLWRFCNGRKDYQGDQNHWFKWPCFSVTGFEAYITCIRELCKDNPNAKKVLDTLN